MAGTTTLATTTLLTDVGQLDDRVQLASISGVVVGMGLYVDREMMRVLRMGVGTWVIVLRGVDTTSVTPHGNTATVTIGRADQFYAYDPRGVPPNPVLVSPWINVQNGLIWYAQGDAVGPQKSARYWKSTTTTNDTGALGVRTAVTTPTSST